MVVRKPMQILLEITLELYREAGVSLPLLGGKFDGVTRPKAEKRGLIKKPRAAKFRLYGMVLHTSVSTAAGACCQSLLPLTNRPPHHPAYHRQAPVL